MDPTSELCSPPTTDFTNPQRAESDFDKLDELKKSFILDKKTFHQQYSGIYSVRLNALRPVVEKVAVNSWGKLAEQPEYVGKILDTRADEICYMIGTIYIEMPQKPNVMNNLDDEAQMILPPTPLKYMSDQDKIFIEDESGRVEIVGKVISNENMVTGTVVGILGCETATGEFEVKQICFPEMGPQAPLPEKDGNKYVALVSGLNIGGKNADTINAQLLAEYLSGTLGSSLDESESATITRVIIAGNSLVKPPSTEANEEKRFGFGGSHIDATHLFELDDILQDICSSVDVDIMPGGTDPAQLHLPQQPLHPSMFPRSVELSTFHGVTNPYWCKIDDVTFLGTSGQNIDDIYRYVGTTDRLELAKCCMKWRHIAPSAPDTLWCYPFQEKDPFILDQCPHVYFIGNQPQFDQDTLIGPDGQQVKVVLVPSFSETKTIVLVNINTLECKTININVDTDEMME